MSITLKAWEQAKSAEVTKGNNFPDFPAGRNIETKVTELTCKFRDDDPEKPDFMLKFQTTDDKPIRGAKFYACYDRSGVSKAGKEWSADGDVDTQNLVSDIKRMGYDLSSGDDVTIEDVMKAISDDLPVVTVDCVVKKGGNGKEYRNIYLNEFVRYSGEESGSDTPEATEAVTEAPATPETPVEEEPIGFIPNAGMLVLAKPGKCKKVEEYKVILSGEDTCTIRRIRDKEVYEDVPFNKVFSEVE